MKSLLTALATAAGLTALSTAAQAERWHYLMDQRIAEHTRLIDEGRRDGALTVHEARELRIEQDRIRRAIARARADGTLYNFERDVIRAMQDSAAEHIFELRNNDQTARGFALWRY